MIKPGDVVSYSPNLDNYYDAKNWQPGSEPHPLAGLVLDVDGGKAQLALFVPDPAGNTKISIEIRSGVVEGENRGQCKAR